MIVNLVQNSPEWHAWRLGGLGGSDSPAAMERSPYKTRRQLYFEKIGEAVEADDSKEFIFAKGHRTESLVRAEFEKLVGASIEPLCLQHDKEPWMRASLDGFHPQHGVLEGKLVGQEVLKRAAEKAEIPDHHMIQMQKQLFVAEHDLGQWYGHDGKKNGVLVEVRRNESMINFIRASDEFFWTQHVEKRIPPELSENDYLTVAHDVLLKDLRDAKELAENAQTHFENLRKMAVEKFKHCKIEGEGLKLYKTVRAGSIDLMAIPEVLAAVETAKQGLSFEYLESFRKKSSESWTVKIDAPKKAAK